MVVEKQLPLTLADLVGSSTPAAAAAEQKLALRDTGDKVVIEGDGLAVEASARFGWWALGARVPPHAPDRFQ